MGRPPCVSPNSARFYLRCILRWLLRFPTFFPWDILKARICSGHLEPPLTSPPIPPLPPAAHPSRANLSESVADPRLACSETPPEAPSDDVEDVAEPAFPLDPELEAAAATEFALQMSAVDTRIVTGAIEAARFGPVVATIFTTRTSLRGGWNKPPHPSRSPHGVDSAVREEAEIRRVFSGAGPDVGVSIACGHSLSTGGFLGIVDEDDPAQLEALEREHGSLPTTRTIRSASGSRHLYFRLVFAPGTSKRPGVELLGLGRYATCPPSVTPDGVAYAVLNEGPIAWLPESWAAFWPKAPRRHPGPPTRRPRDPVPAGQGAEASSPMVGGGELVLLVRRLAAVPTAEATPAERRLSTHIDRLPERYPGRPRHHLVMQAGRHAGLLEAESELSDDVALRVFRQSRLYHSLAEQGGRGGASRPGRVYASREQLEERTFLDGKRWGRERARTGADRWFVPSAVTVPPPPDEGLQPTTPLVEVDADPLPRDAGRTRANQSAPAEVLDATVRDPLPTAPVVLVDTTSTSFSAQHQYLRGREARTSEMLVVTAYGTDRRALEAHVSADPNAAGRILIATTIDSAGRALPQSTLVLLDVRALSARLAAMPPWKCLGVISALIDLAGRSSQTVMLAAGLDRRLVAPWWKLLRLPGDTETARIRLREES